MTTQESNTESNIDAQFNKLAAQIQQLETVIPQLVAYAAENGLKDAALLPGLLETARSALKDAHAQAQQLSIHRDQLQELAHTSALLTSSLELDAVLEDVMDTVIRLTGAERIYLMLRDTNKAGDAPEGDGLTVRAARSWDHSNIQSAEV